MMWTTMMSMLLPLPLLLSVWAEFVEAAADRWAGRLEQLLLIGQRPVDRCYWCTVRGRQSFGRVDSQTSTGC